MNNHPDSILKMIADDGWREALGADLPEGYPEQVAAALALRLDAGERIAPPLSSVFRALEMVPIADVRGVIVGQDPYPGEGDADGLAFSARNSVNLPASLAKIIAELRRDFDFGQPENGDLTPWAERGVLLLNAALTTVVGTAWGHGDIDWETFVRVVLRIVARKSPPSAILLWGSKARAFGDEFAGTAHCLITSDHPKASRRTDDTSGKPFRGSHPFRRANEFLQPSGREIDWRLP
jgi:uracil-DNA glycosylase